MVEWRTIAVVLLSCNVCCKAAIQCPQREQKDSSKLKLNDRIQQLEKSSFTVSDEKYTYTIHICDNGELNGVAVKQKIKENGKTVTVGKFHAAQLLGGADWLLLRYGGGDNYTSHCDGQARLGVILVSCDPSDEKGTINIVEEFSPKVGKNPFHECYYLFELVHKAACLPKSSGLSPGSIVLIIMLALLIAYIGFGFLYQRFIVGAKGIEQIPNLDFWRDFGNLQADGCNFACRCVSREPAKYRTMDDALGDDEDGDDNLLPM